MTSSAQTCHSMYGPCYSTIEKERRQSQMGEEGLSDAMAAVAMVCGDEAGSTP